jgi:predicted phage terminase large subunit-like protein
MVAMCEYLMAVQRGQIRRLIINIPPRHGKSIVTSVLWPTWCWTLDQGTTKWIHWSYKVDFSERDSIARKNMVSSPWYTDTWGDKVKLAKDPVRQDRFHLENKGFSLIVSAMGGTGEGADYIVVDDPHSVEQALSDAERARGVRFVRQTLFSRFNNRETGRMVIIMQRLHEEDVTGVLLEAGGWEHLCLQSIAEKRQVISLPISGKVIDRPEGDLLDPIRFPKDQLEVMKTKELGAFAFAGQYQQQPAPAEGGLFPRKNWAYYDSIPSFDRKMISVDASFKDFATSDYVSIQAWGSLGPRNFLLDKITDHLGFDSSLEAIKGMAAKWNIRDLLIEDKANGSAIIESLRKQLRFTVIAVDPQGGKVARAYAISPEHAAGNILLPRDEWAQELVEQAAKFPNAAHDDDVDAMTQYINWVRQHGYALGLIDFLKSETQKAQEDMLNKIGSTGNLAKPATGENTVKCEKCESLAVVKLGTGFRCNACAHQWGAQKVEPAMRAQDVRKMMMER